MLDLKYIFQGVLDYVREKYDYIDVTMNLWFNPLKLIKMDGGRVTVLCGDDWKRSVIEEKYFSSLIDGFQHELEIKEIDLTLITQEEYEAAQAEEQKKKAEEIKKEENKEEEVYINPAYTFNNFVVGSSNRGIL